MPTLPSLTRSSDSSRPDFRSQITVTRRRVGTFPAVAPVPAGVRYRRRRADLQAAGRWGERYLDPGPTRAALLQFIDRYQVSLHTAAQLCLVADATLAALVYPDHHAYGQRLHRDTARSILAVRFDLDALPDDAQLTSIGTARRLEGLACQGWALSVLDERLGRPVNTVAQWRRRQRVTAGHARLIRDLYDQLSMTRGPSTVTAQRARRAGWVPPLGWDDEDLDEPTAVAQNAGAGAGRRLLGDLVDDVAVDELIDEVAIAAAVAGRRVTLTPLERRRAATQLIAQGLSDKETARRLHMQHSTVGAWRRACLEQATLGAAS